MNEPALPGPARRARDPRLDVFRGLCLVMIFINHTPGTIFEHFTSRNFGFSDAAEGFVLMSGIAAGLAYAPALSARLNWPGVARIWGRAWTLYSVHILSVALCLAVVAAGILWLDAAWLLDDGNNLRPIYENTLRAQVGTVLMTHQIGYANILPLYAVLLLAAPFAIRLGWQRPGALLGLSIAVWAAAGLWRGTGAAWELNFPNWPNGGGWFFNPLSWQVLFVTGLLTGMAMRQGRRLVPVTGWLLAPAIAMLVFALVVEFWPAFSARVGHSLWLVQEAGVPWLLTAFDKTYVTGPRLFHILALAYVLSAFPAIRRAAGSAVAAPFALLGRHSLPVFALGTVLAYAGQAIKGQPPAGLPMDSLVIGGGIVLMLLMALARDRLRLR
ncbi:MAG: OpgC domain-containing protein [Paracoccaceae bacterium]